MQIIWNQEAAGHLKNSHTVLELETFDINGQTVTGYCVVPAEKIVLEMSALEFNQTQHAEFIKHYNNKQYEQAIALAKTLEGKFGGELDSFYAILIEKCQAQILNK
jgi:hypothetical protein